MPRGFPRETEIGELSVRRRAFRHRLPVAHLAHVRRLHEESAAHRADIQRRTSGGRIVHLQQSQVALLREHGEGVIVIGRGDDDLIERLIDGLRRRLVHRAVGGDDAAERGNGVARQGAAECGGEFGRGGEAAGVAVLDDGNRRRVREITDDVPRGVRVQDVVEGHLTAMDLARGGDALRRTAWVVDAVERAGLVGVFAVAERLDGLEGQHALGGERGGLIIHARRPQVPGKVVGDDGVVGRDVLECLAGKPAAFGDRDNARYAASPAPEHSRRGRSSR